MNFTIGPGVVLALLCLVSGITLYFFLKARHLERMTMLERDIPLSAGARTFPEVKIGLMCIGVGWGVLMAYILTEGFGLPTGASLYPGLMFFWGGVGLFSSFFVIRKLDEE